MITDSTLKNYLAKNEVIQTSVSSLPLIGNQGEGLLNWQLKFNHLTPSEMYNQYKQITTQLMFVEMDEQKRLTLMADVFKVTERLVAVLHQQYQNQMGFLDEKQQQALDTVLSIYYLAIMFYHSVWQRVAQMPVIPAKKGFAALMGLGRSTTMNDEVIRYCVHAMIGLLHHALFEKQVGYRKDTQVIWQYLNACYHFATTYHWEKLPAIKIANSSLVSVTIQEWYQQCLFAEAANPYALRRPDILQMQNMAASWAATMTMSTETAQPPFLFVNLRGNEPPQLLHAGVAFNPFDDAETCLFLTFLDTERHLSALAQQPTTDAKTKSQSRLARLILENITDYLKPSETKPPIQETCQAVVGFSQIHYMLANKTSLGNLIQAHALPERLRPRNANQSTLNKSTTVDIVGIGKNCYTLHSQYTYHAFDFSGNFQAARSVEPNAINQLQVKSLIALRPSKDADKTWYLGQVMRIEQTPVVKQDADTIDNSVTLDIRAEVAIIGSHLVPCGVRIQNDDHRPLHYVAAFIVPNNDAHTHQQTSLLMARFGYQVNDKLLIRIDNKEVNVRLTELLRITDDVEEYAFVRVQ